MGRNLPDILNRKTDLYNFTCKDRELMHEIVIIAKRESFTLSQIVIEALKEYNERHGAGNSQTLLGSYTPGGLKSDGQMEQMIITTLIASSFRQEMNYKDILSSVVETFGRKDSVKITDRLVKAIREKGFKVWK